MNTLVDDFYRKKKKEEPSFHAAIFLAESQESWEEASQKTPDLMRGWFELSRLPTADRIEFVRDFWQSSLPFHPSFHPYLADFFAKLDDVGVVLSQAKENSPWAVEMVYSLNDNRSFFRGLPPCDEMGLEELKSSVPYSLPRDYLAFLRIHNGFGKLSEMGFLEAGQLPAAKERLVEQILNSEQVLRINDKIIDPGSLIPFYEAGLGSYQCFCTDWYPGNEMGNVYLSGIDYTISNYLDRKGWADQLAFPTFLEWLAFYLEGNSLE